LPSSGTSESFEGTIPMPAFLVPAFGAGNTQHERCSKYGPAQSTGETFRGWEEELTELTETSAGIQPKIVETPLGGAEYARSGAGPALLLLHGAMGGYDQGLLLGRAAVGSAADFEFIALSRPGYLGNWDA
jgi:hypothetical protein